MYTQAQSSIGKSKANITTKARSPNTILYEFFSKAEPTFGRLVELREKGWADPRGDEHFKQQRHKADNAGKQGAWIFYNMMQQIGDELQKSTHALSQLSYCAEDMKILDLCMAPGGFTASALKYNHGATAFGITLPCAQGGHEVLLRCSKSSVLFLDITMLATELGVEAAPLTHPEHANFLSERPYLGHTFQLIFCDGQVLRTHQRAEYREQQEALRLTVSQLIVALQRIREGGTLIMLLHKIEAWDTAELLYLFSHFSSIQVFKPVKKHAIRSSFYLIARNVQPNADAAKSAVKAWKQAWWHATFGGEDGTGGLKVTVDEGYVRTVLDQFGSELVKLSQPIWETQANALSEMYFVK
ncbi:hypothetical protein MMC30_006447 [Trapelia coarctata]|nr:hypothetical protein [Trapelia coarctata]